MYFHLCLNWAPTLFCSNINPKLSQMSILLLLLLLLGVLTAPQQPTLLLLLLGVLTTPQQPTPGKFRVSSMTGFEPSIMCHLLGPHFLGFTLTKDFFIFYFQKIDREIHVISNYKLTWVFIWCLDITNLFTCLLQG